ncbi:hypothetical protein [Novipirellula artificiosorum]|nr:hypothetical protein [Novipirellula artificiosorum]
MKTWYLKTISTSPVRLDCPDDWSESLTVEWRLATTGYDSAVCGPGGKILFVLDIAASAAGPWRRHKLWSETVTEGERPIIRSEVLA